MSKPTRHDHTAALIAATSRMAINASAQDVHADVYVPSEPQNLTWGAFPIDKAPVATVKSGQTVRIDTLSHAGSTQDEPPAEFLAGYGVASAMDPSRTSRLLGGAKHAAAAGRGGGHVLTGRST